MALDADIKAQLAQYLQLMEGGTAEGQRRRRQRFARNAVSGE